MNSAMASQIVMKCKTGFLCFKVRIIMISFSPFTSLFIKRTEGNIGKYR